MALQYTLEEETGVAVLSEDGLSFVEDEASTGPEPPLKVLIGQKDGSVAQWSWFLTSEDTDGVAVEIPEWSDMIWSIDGVAGGATLVIEGSGNNVAFATCSNAATAAAIAISSLPNVVASIENARYMRPRLSTPGAGAIFNVRLTARRTSYMRK